MSSGNGQVRAEVQARTEGQARLEVLADGRIALGGPLVLETVAALRVQAMSLLEGAGQQIVIDLSGVAPADSAGLALLVDLLAWARGGGRTLRYVAPTPALLALARISEVEPLLLAA